MYHIARDDVNRQREETRTCGTRTGAGKLRCHRMTW